MFFATMASTNRVWHVDFVGIWLQDGDTAVGLSVWILVFAGLQLLLSQVTNRSRFNTQNRNFASKPAV